MKKAPIRPFGADKIAPQTPKKPFLASPPMYRTNDSKRTKKPLRWVTQWFRFVRLFAVFHGRKE